MRVATWFLALALFASVVPDARAQTPPSPSPSPDASAQICERDANVVAPVQPYYPDSARGLDLGFVSTYAEVLLTSEGKVSDIRVIRSSGNAAIDQATIRAARLSTYTPRLLHCVASDGEYVFRADFDSDPNMDAWVQAARKCGVPSKPPVLAKRVVPEVPYSARILGIRRTFAIVEVTVSEIGAVTSTKIVASSGNSAIDTEAARAALASHYTPGVSYCKPAAGTQMFVADFDS